MEWVAGRPAQQKKNKDGTTEKWGRGCYCDGAMPREKWQHATGSWQHAATPPRRKVSKFQPQIARNILNF